jgi:hypothetical protein
VTVGNFWLTDTLATAAKAQVPQVLGIWELDLRSSVLPATFPLASETRSYDLRADGYLVNLVTRKSTNGHPDFIQVVSKSDGKDYPQYQSGLLATFQIDGTKTPVTYSETVIDDHKETPIKLVFKRVAGK